MKDKLYKMMNWPEIEAIVYGEEGKPQTILGRHSVSTYTLFQTFQPDVKEVTLVLDEDKENDKCKEYIMEMADEEGFYAIAILGKIKGKYHYRITDIKGKKHTVYDPYDFKYDIEKKGVAAISAGSSKDAYKVMGAHPVTIDGVKGVGFRVWAPNAIRVSVIGDFNNWNGKTHPMMKDDENGMFSLFIPGLNEGCAYKYEISIKGGYVYKKLDPYAMMIADNNCLVPSELAFDWKDGSYMKSRKTEDAEKALINIYQMNVTSVMKDSVVDSTLLEKKIELLKKANFTHVQLNLQSDYKYVLSCGLSSKDLQALVDAFHIANIGVIAELNLSYFVNSEDGLGIYDGTYLYGHLDERKRFNLAFGGCYFNYSRPEVISYLMSNIGYFLNEFHIDGLHFAGLSSMLYLDYGKNDGEWVANIYGTAENLEAIELVKNINGYVHKDFKGVITTTLEEGAYPKVTSKTEDGGLGFDYIWNNGLTDDYLEFLRGENHFKAVNRLTDNMAYAYCENYIVTLSKNDVIKANDNDVNRVENGATFFDYVPVSDEKKKDVMRATIAYFMARPGKKLIFEGQGSEDVLEVLGNLYKDTPALSSLDCSPYGFEWINAINTGDGVVSFLRKDEYLNHSIFVVCNYSDKEYKSYKFGIPYEGKYKMIFCSDDKKLGGKSAVSNRFKETEDEFYDGRPNSLTVKIPAMSVSFFSYTPYNEEELLKIAEEKVRKYKEKMEKEAIERAKELKVKTIK